MARTVLFTNFTRVLIRFMCFDFGMRHEEFPRSLRSDVSKQRALSVLKGMQAGVVALVWLLVGRAKAFWSKIRIPWKS